MNETRRGGNRMINVFGIAHFVRLFDQSGSTKSNGSFFIISISFIIRLWKMAERCPDVPLTTGVVDGEGNGGGLAADLAGFLRLI